MRKKYLITPFLVIALVWGASAQELKVGAVDLGHLLVEAPQAQQTQETLESEFGSRRDQLRTQQQQLNSAIATLQQSAQTLGQSALRAEELNLRKQQRQLASAQDSFLAEFNQRRNQELDALQRQIIAQIERFALDKNYDLIVGEGVILSSDETDVTSQVLIALKQNFSNHQEGTK